MRRIEDFRLKDFISYLKKTKPQDWLTDVVRSKDNSKNCVMGHLVNYWYGKDYKGRISEVWDFFEEMIATEYMVYPVNDGKNPKYKQKTAKARIIAYLENIENGREKTTQDYYLKGEPSV